jgi:hypothetical protein
MKCLKCPAGMKSPSARRMGRIKRIANAQLSSRIERRIRPTPG